MFNGFNFNDLGPGYDETLGLWFPEDYGTGPSTPTYNTGAPWWSSIINQGIGLTSQIIGAYGHNPTQQIGYGIQSYGHGGYAPQLQIPPNAGELPNNNSPGNGGLAEDAFGDITKFISKHPLPIAAGVIGLYLLMREPPRPRR